MSRLRVITALTTVGMVLVASQWCFATPSITLLPSSGGGVYEYGVTVLLNEFAQFDPNATITLSGLSGVTGASTSSDHLGVCFSVNSVTPTSVEYIQTFIFGTPCTTSSMGFPMITTGTLFVDSSVLTLGTVDFSMETANLGTITGTTQGPVGAVPVPEPASLVLLGTGLLGLVGLARRTWSR